MTAAAVLLVAALLAPHAIGAWRGLTAGRSAIRSHRQSVRLGVRVGRWQVVCVTVMALLLIGAAR